MTTALNVTDLQIQFDGQPILELPEFAVAPQEVVGLVGLSGAGKTSFLRAVAGDLTAISGRIRIGEESLDSAHTSALAARTIQSFPLLHWLTVRQSIALAGRLRGVRRFDIDETLRRCHAEHLADRRPQRLSGGERCRVSLAAALLGSPRVLLLDEPFNGLDSLVKRDLAESLLGSARELRCGVVLVTHDLHDAAEFCDRAVVLSGKEPATIAGTVDCQAPHAADRIFNLLKRGVEASL